MANPHYEGVPPTGKPWEDDKRKELKLMPAGLDIVWGRDKRYWKLPEDDKPYAELLQVCWLEVTGSVPDTNPEKEYEVIFNVSLTPDAFGWGGCPVYIMVQRGVEGKFASKKHLLAGGGESAFDVSCKSVKSEKNTDRNLYFGFYEVWSGKWKGGLKIHHVIVKEV